MRRAAGMAVLLLATLFDGAHAQPFDWFLGGGARQGPTRHLRGRAARTQIVVPLPPPRPHLASDPQVAGEGAVAREGTAPMPLPPQKPADRTPMDQKSMQKDGVAAPPHPALPTATAVQPDAQPGVAPSGASKAFDPKNLSDDPGCPARLADRKVEAEPIEIGKQPDERCTVMRPVRLAGLTLRDGRRVDFPDRPVVACETADAFSAYVADLLSPLAKGSLGAAVATVWTGPGLECRSRDHMFGAKLSAHGQGLAVDIAQLKLEDGRAISVGAPTTPVEQAFEDAARAGGCGYFHTTLGPGSDSYHRTHWHFDLEVRGSHGDTKYCH